MDVQTIRNELITAARFRVQRFQELILLAEEQRSILMERRHADLPENLRKHDPLLIELAKVEKREESLHEMLAQAGPEAEPSADFESVYGEINQQTRELAVRLRTLVAGNTELLRTMMEYVQFSINIVSKLISEQQSYDPATDHSTAAALMLDRKV